MEDNGSSYPAYGYTEKVKKLIFELELIALFKS